MRFNHLPGAKRATREQASALIRAVGLEAERYVKQSFGTSPSPAGGPPGVDTGALRASIHVEMTDALTALLSDGVAYGIHLEFGTTRMAARPFMTPVIPWAAQNVVRIARGMKWGV